METLPVAEQDAFRRDLLLAREASQHAVGLERAKSKENTWNTWVEFCATLQIHPLLNHVEDPILYFQVFGARFRDGRLAYRGKPVRYRTVEDAWRKVGQTMASLGSKDHRNMPGGNKLVYRLSQQLKGYARDDDPTTRVKPVPLSLVRRVWETATTNQEKAVGDMCLIGFFFLCRPGEHVETTSESQSRAFRLEDVHLLVGCRWWLASQIPLASLDAARFATLHYTTQKNGVQGQGITLGPTGHRTICPVKALLRRVKHLRANNAPDETPIHAYFEPMSGERQDVYSVHLTCALRAAAAELLSTLGIEPKDISARSLRPGGATAMLCAKIDRDITQLIGRWKSDEMLKYLHVQAASLMANYARQMFEHGEFSFTSTQDITDPDTFLKRKPAPQKQPATHPVP